MFINDLKKEVGKELKIAAKLMKQGSPVGFNHLRNTLGHALFFAYEDEAIALLQHILAPVRPEVINIIVAHDKEIIVAIGKDIDSIADMLVKEESWETMLKPLLHITLMIEKEWRNISTSSNINIPLSKVGVELS